MTAVEQALKEYFAASGSSITVFIENLSLEGKQKLCSYLDNGAVLGVETVFGREGAAVSVFAQAPDGQRLSLQTASMPKANQRVQ